MPNPINLLFDYLYRSFTSNTTSNLLAQGAKSGIFNSGGGGVKRLGRVYEDAVIRSLGETKNTKTFKASPISPRGVIPDLVGNSTMLTIDPIHPQNTTKITFVNASFVDAKMSSKINFVQANNPEQFKQMIDVLSSQKGGYVDNKWNPNIKASDYGSARLTLITPENGVVNQDLLNYASSKNVLVYQRNTEQDESDPNRIRVNSFVRQLNTVSTKKTFESPIKAPGQSVELDFGKR